VHLRHDAAPSSEERALALPIITDTITNARRLWSVVMPQRIALLCLLVVGPVFAADPIADTARGDKMLHAYFRSQVKQIAEASLKDYKTRADWEKARPELRRQFLDMLGLWPLPPRTDLHATITGKIETDRFTVEKLQFQSSPGLYVTANLYVPKTLEGKAPAILYVCGHSNTVIDKVSYGSKVPYQRHPTWFAEHGYVCLILDTLQLGESEGLHHGTYRYNMWWWQTLGYTPAGIECWNAMRALDYLVSRPEVDASRLGVTGRSGGGATSWWIAAADERVACAVPVAGIADLQAHVYDGTPGRYRDGAIVGHCDCMFFINTYRWDFDKVMALIAPRPVLLGNSDADDLFPIPGYQRMVPKVRRIYELLGAGDRFALMEEKGLHVDTPELRRGAFQWFNRWLRDDHKPIDGDPDRAPLDPRHLRVFQRLPDDSLNPLIHEVFRKPVRLELPRAPEVAQAWWQEKAPELKTALREQAFRAWPDKPVPLKVRLAAAVKHDGLRLRAYDFVSEEEIELRLWLLTAEKVDKPTGVDIQVVEEAGWENWCRHLGPAFQGPLQVTAAPALDSARFKQLRMELEISRGGIALVAPRGVGPTRWSEVDTSDPKKSTAQHIRRRFALIGETLDGQRVWDVRRAIATLRTTADLADAPISLQGEGDFAGIALYSALFEPAVVSLDLHRLPASHREGPTFLNVRRVLDTPQALALVFPRTITLHLAEDADAKAWEWPLELQQALGKRYLTIRRD
jgi:dienelactone hydrolase